MLVLFSLRNVAVLKITTKLVFTAVLPVFCCRRSGHNCLTFGSEIYIIKEETVFADAWLAEYIRDKTMIMKKNKTNKLKKNKAFNGACSELCNNTRHSGGKFCEYAAK